MRDVNFSSMKMVEGPIWKLSSIGPRSETTTVDVPNFIVMTEWSTVFEMMIDKNSELSAEDVKRTMKKLGKDVPDEHIHR